MRRALSQLTILFALHVLLLMLAATRFTLVTGLGDGHVFHFDYFTYAYRGGWGFQYVSDYSLAQVVAYAAGYGLGLPVFAAAMKQGYPVLGWTGRAFCYLGLYSFLLEASHWISDHHTCWILSAPAVLSLLWLVWGFLALRARSPRRSVPAESTQTP